jgi:hypothetical protein
LKHLTTLSICIAFFIANSIKAQVAISLDDFKILNNTSWEGTLTYLDYKSGELTPVSTTMQITITEKVIEQNIQYTWEPNKNVQAKIKIKKNGTHLGKQKVISKTINDNGTIQLITIAEGKDDNKKATMFYTYEFNSDSYIVLKEVQFKGSNERFMRNTYEYKRL